MKTTLALLITGLFLLTTPLLALADGHNGRDGWRSRDHDRGRVVQRYDGHRHERHYRCTPYRNYRHHRHFRHFRRQLWTRPVERRVYASAPLLVLPPRVVFRIGW